MNFSELFFFIKLLFFYVDNVKDDEHAQLQNLMRSIG